MLSLHSDAFKDGESIPPRYTCEGANVNPGLRIRGVGPRCTSLVLIMDDPDVPKELRPEGVFDHWVVFNMPPGTAELPEGGPIPGVQGVHGRGQPGYTGPCPPTQYKPSEHRYYFKLYALDCELALPEGATKAQVEQAMSGHVLEEAQLVGRYRKQGK